MDERLETILCSRYPKLLPTEGPGCFQLFGFECQDGWFGLIYAACELIQTHANRTGSGQAIASQVKEKFGGLRFYCRGGDDYVESVVELVERLSESICELCGAPGRIYERQGWLVARCPLHEAQGGARQPEAREWLIQGALMAKVLSASLALFAFDALEASRWLTSPARALGMTAPLEHLHAPNGAHDVLNLIGRIEHGTPP